MISTTVLVTGVWPPGSPPYGASSNDSLGMLVHWGAEYLDKLLPSHLQARVKEFRCDPFLETSADIPPVPYVNALTGEKMAEIPMAGINRVSRMKLRQFLTHGENLSIQVCGSLYRTGKPMTWSRTVRQIC